jgi:hypothetical protein
MCWKCWNFTFSDTGWFYLPHQKPPKRYLFEGALGGDFSGVEDHVQERKCSLNKESRVHFADEFHQSHVSSE